ncbi:hypothetical protein BDY19DRAFT_352770 [Irpex rosettiformis]|uniref:Uncharacterized protein n=1 Tax=Irpex rosettiformis TaxID=378272 RepID=A0ACB8TW51_9APHY|nr:hypothetical protein BDY19DRAFT_352770 [Irpex rosettiformis]
MLCHRVLYFLVKPLSIASASCASGTSAFDRKNARQRWGVSSNWSSSRCLGLDCPRRVLGGRGVRGSKSIWSRDISCGWGKATYLTRLIKVCWLAKFVRRWWQELWRTTRILDFNATRIRLNAKITP